MSSPGKRPSGSEAEAPAAKRAAERVDGPAQPSPLSCPVCLEFFDDEAAKPSALVCGHLVCQACCQSSQTVLCPVCRTHQRLFCLPKAPLSFALAELIAADGPLFTCSLCRETGFGRCGWAARLDGEGVVACANCRHLDSVREVPWTPLRDALEERRLEIVEWRRQRLQVLEAKAKHLADSKHLLDLPSHRSYNNILARVQAAAKPCSVSTRLVMESLSKAPCEPSFEGELGTEGEAMREVVELEAGLETLQRLRESLHMAHQALREHADALSLTPANVLPF